eukprot:GHVH01007627.1.p1 GENE.GHVH01007627.1~~GHVH01007627.1.p1  ORF type:complete len:316 (+),score=43.67 GHVH01007627.1:126-1073(+)
MPPSREGVRSRSSSLQQDPIQLSDFAPNAPDKLFQTPSFASDEDRQILIRVLSSSSAILNDDAARMSRLASVEPLPCVSSSRDCPSPQTHPKTDLSMFDPLLLALSHNNVEEVIAEFSRLMNLDSIDFIRLLSRHDSEDETPLVEVEERSDSYLYEGQVNESGLKHGYGLLRWSCGSSYLGSFNNNQLQGLGRMAKSDGEYYIGGWFNDVRSNFGVLKFLDGDYYIGRWEEDKLHGQGAIVFAEASDAAASSSIYVGNFDHDHINGYGRMSYCSGDFYEGNWQDGSPCGHGKIVYREGPKCLTHSNGGSRSQRIQ